jgi:hypothetical protein
LELYRWNTDHFEMADVAKATHSEYAMLIHVEGQYRIEAGTWEDGNGESRIYKYDQGKLVTVD